MTPRRLLKLCATLALLGGTLGTSCGRARTIGYRFALASCPDSAFALPVEAQRDAYRVTAKVRDVYRAPKGAGYTTYQFIGPAAKTNPPGYFAVRLTRADSCTLDLAWGYMLRDTANDRRLELAYKLMAEHAALILLAGTPFQPSTPAFQTDTARSLSDWAGHRLLHQPT